MIVIRTVGVERARLLDFLDQIAAITQPLISAKRGCVMTQFDQEIRGRQRQWILFPLNSVSREDIPEEKRMFS